MPVVSIVTDGFVCPPDEIPVIEPPICPGGPHDILRTGMQWLTKMMAVHRQTEITYNKAGNLIEGLIATVGRTVFEVADDYGNRIKIESRDFIILTEKLDFTLEFDEMPEQGDLITEVGCNGVIYTYEVMAAMEGAHHWRWMDHFRSAIRIHTKEINKEQPAP